MVVKKIITSVFLAGIVFSLQAGKKKYKKLLIGKQKKDVVTGVEFEALQKKIEKKEKKHENFLRMNQYVTIEEFKNLMEEFKNLKKKYNKLKRTVERHEYSLEAT